MCTRKPAFSTVNVALCGPCNVHMLQSLPALRHAFLQHLPIDCITVLPLPGTACLLRRYYYNAGAALYALKQNHQLLYELGGWEGLQGRPVCLKTGGHGGLRPAGTSKALQPVLQQLTSV